MDLPPAIVSIRSSATPPTATAQQKGAFCGHDGRVHFFTKAKVREAESDWWHIVQPFAPSAPLDGPLWIRVCLAWQYTAGTPKRIQKAGKLMPLDRRPDLDNLLKAMLDVLTKCGIVREDARIALIIASKVRGPHAGVSIDIGTLPHVLESWTAPEQMDLPLFATDQETE